MEQNTSRAPDDERDLGRTANSLRWLTQMNDALGELNDDSFLDFNPRPVLRGSHQRSNSTPALTNVAALPGTQVNDGRSSAFPQQDHTTNHQSQMVGIQPLSSQIAHHMQQLEFQPLSIRVNPFLSPDPQPSADMMDNTVSQWDPLSFQIDEPMLWASDNDLPFINMGTGALEDPANGFTAVNMDNTAIANSINYESIGSNNMDQAGLGSLNTDLVPMTARLHNTNPYLSTYSHFRTQSHASNTSSMSMNSDLPFFEPPKSGLNDYETSNLLRDIFGPEHTSDAMGSRFQIPQYAMGIGSPGTTVTNSPGAPRTPQSGHRRSQSLNSVSPVGGPFQLATHPATMIRQNINASPTPAGPIRPRQSPLRNSVEFTPPSPVPPGAPVKRKRRRRDKEEIARGLNKKRPRVHHYGSAPVTPSAALMSSPSSDPSAFSTPKKCKAPRSPARPYPKSWKSASVGDCLLFELKNAGGTWDQITESYNDLNKTTYTKATLQNRYHGIKHSIGNPPGTTPEEELPLPRHLDGFVLDTNGLHQIPYLNRLINGPPEQPDKAEDKAPGSDVDAEGETDPEA